MRARVVSRTIRALAFATIGVVACRASSSEPDVVQKQQPGSGEPLCVPGRSVVCGGPGGCVGYQVCADDGTRLLPCMCSAPMPPPPASPDPLDPTVAGWEQRCRAPDGPGITFGSIADVAPQLVGKWWSCFAQPSYYGGLELTADGHYYTLTFVDGGLERNLGPDTSGTYELLDAGGLHFEMKETTADNSCCTQPGEGDMQTTPPGKMMLSGGSFMGGLFLRLP